MPNSYTKLIYHLVFATKHRQAWLTDELRPRVYEYLAGAVRSEGGFAICINGIEDHIHLLARLRQDRALSDVLRDLKANSSGWIHETFPSHVAFAWQAGYGAFTVSQSQVPRVEEYIANQDQHHRKLSFKEELLALLRAHEIEFDERYLWD